MRDMINASSRSAWLYSRVTALGEFRRDLPTEAMPPDIALVRRFTRGTRVRFDHGGVPVPADVAVRRA